MNIHWLMNIVVGITILITVQVTRYTTGRTLNSFSFPNVRKNEFHLFRKRNELLTKSNDKLTTQSSQILSQRRQYWPKNASISGIYTEKMSLRKTSSNSSINYNPIIGDANDSRQMADLTSTTKTTTISTNGNAKYFNKLFEQIQYLNKHYPSFTKARNLTCIAYSILFIIGATANVLVFHNLVFKSNKTVIPSEFSAALSRARGSVTKWINYNLSGMKRDGIKTSKAVVSKSNLSNNIRLDRATKASCVLEKEKVEHVYNTVPRKGDGIFIEEGKSIQVKFNQIYQDPTNEPEKIALKNIKTNIMINHDHRRDEVYKNSLPNGRQITVLASTSQVFVQNKSNLVDTNLIVKQSQAVKLPEKSFKLGPSASANKQHHRFRIQSRVRMLILQLCIADLMVIFLMVPLEVIWAFTVFWLAGDAMCRIMMFFRIFGLYLSSLILMAISIDRCYTICYPLRFNQQKRLVKGMIIACWVIAIISSLPQGFIFKVRTHPNLKWYKQCVTFGRFKSPKLELAYNLFCSLIMYVLPLITVVTCYSIILWKVRKNATNPQFKCKIEDTKPLVTKTYKNQENMVENVVYNDSKNINDKDSSENYNISTTNHYHEIHVKPAQSLDTKKFGIAGFEKNVKNFSFPMGGLIKNRFRLYKSKIGTTTQARRPTELPGYASSSERLNSISRAYHTISRRPRKTIILLNDKTIPDTSQNSTTNPSSNGKEPIKNRMGHQSEVAPLDMKNEMTRIANRMHTNSDEGESDVDEMSYQSSWLSSYSPLACPNGTGDRDFNRGEGFLQTVPAVSNGVPAVSHEKNKSILKPNKKHPPFAGKQNRKTMPLNRSVNFEKNNIAKKPFGYIKRQSHQMLLREGQVNCNNNFRMCNPTCMENSHHNNSLALKEPLMVSQQKGTFNQSQILRLRHDKFAKTIRSKISTSSLRSTFKLKRLNTRLRESGNLKTLKMTAIIIAAFVFCWTPYNIMSFWYYFSKETASKVDPNIQKCLFIFAAFNSCFNPLIYGFFNIRKNKTKVDRDNKNEKAKPNMSDSKKVFFPKLFDKFRGQNGKVEKYFNSVSTTASVIEKS